MFGIQVKVDGEWHWVNNGPENVFVLETEGEAQFHLDTKVKHELKRMGIAKDDIRVAEIDEVEAHSLGLTNKGPVIQ